ncbi:MAG TPA: glycerate kinase, partial [Clostridiales bacterium]|nr:glycerate kinase [Clostridiales bacterium]
AIQLVSGLSPEDKVLFLISGGGSALFEKPLIPKEMLEELTKQLLASGADIIEMNTIRKRLSAVKGGKFARLCEPAQVYSVVLSDIIGDPLDMIASGPAYPDSSTNEQALEIIRKYNISAPEEVKRLLNIKTP